MTGTPMLRIALFFATNIAILVVISIVFQILGLESILAENQVDLNLEALLVMSAVIGFSGSAGLTGSRRAYGVDGGRDNRASRPLPPAASARSRTSGRWPCPRSRRR